MKLYKNTIVIWTDYNAENTELDDLGSAAIRGNAICTQQESVLVDPLDDPDIEEAVLSFFDID